MEIGKNINDSLEGVIEYEINLTVGELIRVRLLKWNLAEKLIWDSIDDTVTVIWGQGVYQIMEKTKWK